MIKKNNLKCVKLRPIDRQYNGQKNKEKGTHNNIQYTTQKTKDWALRALFHTGHRLKKD
jgi:hypothetical protein